MASNHNDRSRKLSVITWRGLVVITDGEVTPDNLRDLRRHLWRNKVQFGSSGNYDLVLTDEQARQLEESLEAEYRMMYYSPLHGGLGTCEGFRIVDIARTY